MNLEHIKKEFFDGVAGQLHRAQYQYFIFRTIGENYEHLSKKIEKGSSESKRITYLQSASHDLCILLLNTLFEKKSKRDYNYCFDRLLIAFENNAPSNILAQKFSSIHLKELKTLADKENSEVATVSDISSLIRLALHRSDIKDSIEQLNFVRNKAVAHKQRLTSFDLNEFWWSYESLIYLAGIIRNVILSHIFGMHINWSNTENKVVIDGTICIEAYWIVKEILDLTEQNQVITTLPKFSNLWGDHKFHH